MRLFEDYLALFLTTNYLKMANIEKGCVRINLFL